MRGGVWSWVSGVAFAGVIASFWIFIASGGPERLDTGDKISSIGSLIVGFASLLVALVALRQAMQVSSIDPATQLQRAISDLAQLVDRQWEREAGIRGLLHPEPLRVQWSSTGRPVAAPASEVVEPIPGVRPIRLRLNGDVSTVAETWKKLPAQQLVIIGAPGAGKTTLTVLLVRQLLARRQIEEPVPVLLTLAGWDPENVHLETWLTERIKADYPQLMNKRTYGLDATMRLVDRSCIIPVLDGLDEMPEKSRGNAIAALNMAVANNRPLVLTCRSDEYEQAIAQAGTPLSRAVVVELKPVKLLGISHYLTSGQVDGNNRWAGVLENLRAEPAGILAQTLSTPLMVYLARVAYSTPAANPADLLKFNDINSTRNHLISAYLPMMYRPRQPEKNKPRASKEYRLEKSQKWLSFFAQSMDSAGTRGISPWSFQPPIFASWKSTLRAGTILTSILVALILAAKFPGNLGQFGEIVQIIPTLLISFLLISTTIDVASRSENIRPTRIRIQPLRFILGAIAGPLALIAFSFVIVYTFQWLGLYDFPERGNRSERNTIGTILIMLSMAGGAVAAGLTRRISEIEAPDPIMALRHDRKALLIVTLFPLATSGILFTILVGGTSTVLTGMFFGLILVTAPAQAFGVGKAWLNWQLNRAWLSAAGVAPWDLLDFLEDAHYRGVLRVVGMQYQFRHAILQDHLTQKQN